jgi:tetratricopeptide (TPR) repeat protein
MREFELAASYDREGNVPGALNRLRVALELYPENVRAHLLLGAIHGKREDFAAAEASMREAVRLLSERGPEAGSMMPVAQDALALALSRQERWDEAIPLFREAASDPLNTHPELAWYHLGEAYYEKGDYAEALTALSQAVRVQPRYCVAHFLIGKVHFAMDALEPAEEAFTRSLEADQRCDAFQDAWKLRGETRARLGDREGAIHDFERCVQLAERSEAGLACKRFLEAD